MNVLMEYCKVFITGGLLCVIAQILIDRTKLGGAKILVGYVVSGVILSSCGLYGKLVDFASMGARVPLCGFGHLLATGVKKAVDENGFFGILSGGLAAASVGICTAVTSALVLSFVCKSKRKS